ncbi:hypothetical protein EDC54_10680 [Samsonia erythrinae]|uniref:Uncharacterized protein n=1 Tax=Samsonia erythrinae TaxID=160434 RepID=A0A4V2VT87_9GAMM|nr:hypothetical protein EDC54_10680 [Samsonia erythrinae]
MASPFISFSSVPHAFVLPSDFLTRAGIRFFPANVVLSRALSPPPPGPVVVENTRRFASGHGDRTGRRLN